MPLDKLVLIIICVIVAAGLTIWLGVLFFAALENPQIGFVAVLPIALIGYIVWRVIAERMKNKEDDHYDRIEK